MSCLGLKNQHLPPRKVWNNFISKFQSRLSKLKRSKALKRAKVRLNTMLHRPSRSSHPLRRKRGHTRRLHRHRNFAPVYVAELYNQPMPECVECVEPFSDANGEKASRKSATSDQLGVMFVSSSPSSSSSSSSSSSFCGTSLSVVGEMGEVDLRAEMFIRKFREEMRLQRQRSFGEYQEMLARGL